MSKKAIKNLIDTYQRQRLCFIQALSTYANNKCVLDILIELNVLDLIIPLLNDTIPSIQLVALNTIGKVICTKDNGLIAPLIIDMNLVSHILKDWSNHNKHYQHSAIHILKCAAQHDEKIANIIIQNNGLEYILQYLQDGDRGSKENAALTLGSIAAHSKNLAQKVVDSGVVPVLIELLQSHILSLKYAATFAFKNICKHSLDLAENIVDNGAVPLLAKALNNNHVKLKIEILALLDEIAKHSPTLAENIVDNGVVPVAIEHLTYPHEGVQKNAATLIRDISKHNLSLVNNVVQHGGVIGLLDLIDTQRCSSISATIAIGYIAAQSAPIATDIIEKGGVQKLGNILNCENDETLKGAAVWTLSQLGKHSVHHATALCDEDILLTLLRTIKQSSSSEHLKTRCKNGLNLLLPKCRNTDQLEKLFLDGVPDDILGNVFCAFIKVLPHNAISRRNFVTSGCLKMIQQIDNPDLKNYVDTINACFPDEIVEYVSPGYPEVLIDRVDHFIPGKPPFFPNCNVSPSASMTSISKSETSDTGGSVLQET